MTKKLFIIFTLLMCASVATYAVSKKKTAKAAAEHLFGKSTPGKVATSNGLVVKGSHTGDPLYYKIIDDNKKLVEVTNSVRSAKLSNKITIYPTIKINDTEYRVVNIGENAFAGCAKITSIEILGNTLQKLCHKCFAGCTGLTNITLNTNCQNVKNDAFVGCTNLKTIKVSSRANNFTFVDCNASVVKY